MNVYVASSWRNPRQPEVVDVLRAEGYTVYDFRNPSPDDHGFHWSSIDPDWQTWTPKQFRKALKHPLAQKGFCVDFSALARADAVVLVMPCGRSAHLELGYAIGARKLTTILLADGEPELMYLLPDQICISLDEVCAFLAGRNPGPERKKNPCPHPTTASCSSRATGSTSRRPTRRSSR